MKPANSAKRLKRAKADKRSSKPAKKNGPGKARKSGQGNNNKAKKGGGGGGLGVRQPNNLEAARNKVSQPLVGTIAHAKPTIGRQEQQAAAMIVRSGIMASGPEVSVFEDEFCTFLGLAAGHAVATVNSTVALYLAMEALGSKNRKVALPAYGYPVLKAAAALAGADAVIVDSPEGQTGIDLEAATATGAVAAVLCHHFGLPVRVHGHSSKIKIIEDCSDALGARVGETFVGLQGDCGVFSFGVNDIITSGGHGGMVVARDKALVDRMRALRDRLDFAMSDLQAAVGRVQLAKLPNLLARREEIFGEYASRDFHLVDCEDDLTPVRARAVLRSNDCEAIVEILVQGMIEAQIPISEEVLLGPAADFPNAADMAVSTFAIPIYPHLSNAEVIEIADQVEEALEQFAEGGDESDDEENEEFDEDAPEE